MTPPRVIVVGGLSCSPESLASEVLSLAARAVGRESSILSATTTLPVDGTLSAPLALSTKYYTSTVEIVVLPTSAFTDPESFEWSSEGVEAVVLVFDVSLPLAASSAATWAARVADVPTLLAVAMRAHMLSERDRAPAIAALNEWALDCGFELVVITAAAGPLQTEEGSSVDSRDKVGVPRILEALESTMWSNLERIDFARMDAAPAAVALVAAADEEASAYGRAGAYQQPSVGVQALPAVMVTNKDAAVPEPKAEREFDFADFGALLEEARAVRDLARSGSVDDDKRRNAAASVAQKLLAMLAAGGGDGDEDGEDGEDVDDQ